MANKKYKCESCGIETKYDFNGLCYDCFIREEKLGNIKYNYPKVYKVNDIDTVVTPFDMQRTIDWYEKETGCDTDLEVFREIDIEKEGYWESEEVFNSPDTLEDCIYDLINYGHEEYCYLKQSNNRDTFGDISFIHGDIFKYISYKEGILKFHRNLTEPCVIASTEF